MIDLMQLPASEAECLAYAEGFTGTAELFKRIADLEAQVDSLTELMSELTYQAREDIPGDSATRHFWEAVKAAEEALKP